MAKRKPRPLPPPPDRLSDGAKAAWREIVAQHGAHAYMVVGPVLEEFCEALAVSREASERVAAEGMIVADPKGFPIDHPALAIGARAQRTVERLAPRFAPPVDRRRRGYLAEKTLLSVKAAGLDAEPRFEAVIAGVMTLATVIDNAQAQGVAALQKTAFGPIQSYIQGLETLGLTPKLASVDAETEKESAGAVSLEGWISSKGA